MRVLALVTDSFGGYGGIAQFNRHYLTALCDADKVIGVTVVTRQCGTQTEDLPPKLAFLRSRSNSKISLVTTLLKVLFSDDKFDLVICGHINLLPLAWLAARKKGARLALIMHGTEVWDPPRRRLGARFLRAVNHFHAVSKYTCKRFMAWANVDATRIKVIPNGIDLTGYQIGSRPAELETRHRLENKKVLLTVGRLSHAEQAKGFDQVIRALPSIRQHIPEVAYLIVGEGDDLQRLKQLCTELELTDFVVFTGKIEEQEKIKYYQLADAYVMPSRMEGFGYVYLEAMACGLPVVGSKTDGSSEPLLDGKLGELIDPDNLEEISNASIRALKKPKHVPEELDRFSLNTFQDNVRDSLNLT